MSRPLAFLALLFFALCMSCGDDADLTQDGGAPDASLSRPDATMDAGRDASIDATIPGVDASTDAGGADAALDAGNDAGCMFPSTVAAEFSVRPSAEPDPWTYAGSISETQAVTDNMNGTFTIRDSVSGPNLDYGYYQKEVCTPIEDP